MELHLKDKVALITGGASGIGESITRTLAAEGVIAVIAGRSADKAQPILDELQAAGLRADFVHVELTDELQVQQAVAMTVQRHGGLDILINNAGVNDSISLDAGVDAFRASLEKNLTQIYACTHSALPHLRASQGCIINIGSKVAETGQGGTSGYAASKGGMNSLTRDWAIELADDNIRVNTVIPADVWTPLYERWLNQVADDPAAARDAIGAKIPLGRRMTTCEEIADMVVFLTSSRSSHTTGQIIYVDGGYTHLDRACTLDSAF
jgi:L-fucose dehydrogenase